MVKILVQHGLQKCVLLNVSSYVQHSMLGCKVMAHPKQHLLFANSLIGALKVLIQQPVCSVLELPAAEEEKDLSGNIVFRGPRVKMGVYCGVPTRVVPHTTTGRADYFGQVVNRAARYCHAAARGGQVGAMSHVIRAHHTLHTAQCVCWYLPCQMLAPVASHLCALCVLQSATLLQLGVYREGSKT